MVRLSLALWLTAASAASTTPQVIRHILEGSGSAEPAMIYNVPEDSHWEALAKSRSAKLCVVNPDEDGGDDAPAIIKHSRRTAAQIALWFFLVRSTTFALS